MGALMASQDVANKLSHLEAQLSVHEQLHVQSAETLREVKNVLVSNAKISQQLVHVDKRLDNIDGRFDKIETRVETNHNKIVYWSGCIGAVLALITLAGAVVKLSQQVQ